MKKLIILAACISVWACKKEGITPDPLPEEPTVVEPVAEDTTMHNLINDWNNYQYKYTDPNTKNLWLYRTSWNVRLTKDTIKIDEAKDGTYEKIYPVSFQSSPTLSVITIFYPGQPNPIPKAYEIRRTRIGKKHGYDLIGIADIDRDVYSFVK